MASATTRQTGKSGKRAHRALGGTSRMRLRRQLFRDYRLSVVFVTLLLGGGLLTVLQALDRSPQVVASLKPHNAPYMFQGGIGTQPHRPNALP